jgi:hypothetical protein
MPKKQTQVLQQQMQWQHWLLQLLQKQMQHLPRTQLEQQHQQTQHSSRHLLRRQLHQQMLRVHEMSLRSLEPTAAPFRAAAAA